MSRRYLNIIIFIMVIGLSSCYKKAIKYDSNFSGYWKSLDEVHNIEFGYDDVYNGTYWTNSDDFLKGKARTNGSKLKIGTKVFQINQLPTFDSTSVYGDPVYSMILDGIVYISYKHD